MRSGMRLVAQGQVKNFELILNEGDDDRGGGVQGDIWIVVAGKAHPEIRIGHKRLATKSQSQLFRSYCLANAIKHSIERDLSFKRLALLQF